MSWVQKGLEGQVEEMRTTKEWCHPGGCLKSLGPVNKQRSVSFFPPTPYCRSFLLIDFYWSLVALECCVSSTVQRSEAAIQILRSFLEEKQPSWGRGVGVCRQRPTTRFKGNWDKRRGSLWD